MAAPLGLSAAEVAGLASRFAELLAAPQVVERCVAGRADRGRAPGPGDFGTSRGWGRPAARRHRRGGPLPPVLDVAEGLRWRDPVLAEVLRLVDERAGFPPAQVPAWQHRLHGRYAYG